MDSQKLLTSPSPQSDVPTTPSVPAAVDQCCAMTMATKAATGGQIASNSHECVQCAALVERATQLQEEVSARVPISTVDGLTDKERALKDQLAEAQTGRQQNAQELDRVNVERAELVGLLRQADAKLSDTGPLFVYEKSAFHKIIRAAIAKATGAQQP